MAQENPSVSRFREYLRINTMHPDPNYGPAVEFLRKEAESIGLDFFVHESDMKGKSIVQMTWKGTKPELQSILLSSHMDVVPVFPDKWTYPPFSAHKDEKGDIYARGSQDMKCVSNWYLEAIRKLKSEGRKLPRTIHLLFTPDEEIGSDPLVPFIKSKVFKELNARFGLDEGIAHPSDEVRVFYGERSVWWIKVKCEGQPGHGSSFIENTAAKKLQYMINKFLDFRTEQEKKFKDNPEKGLGAVTSVNMTMLEGGVQPNVVPALLSATFDVRVSPFVDFDELENTFKTWCEEAGSGVSMEFIQKGFKTPMVKVNDSNPFWTAFQEGCKQSNVKIQTQIFPAATDSRFYRQNGVEMLGFSPLNNTPQLLHDHDEFLNEDVFLRGIDIYCNMLPALANVED